MILSDHELAFHLRITVNALRLLQSLIQREKTFGLHTGHTEEAGPVAAALWRQGYAEECPAKGRSSLRYRLNDVGRNAIKLAHERHGGSAK